MERSGMSVEIERVVKTRISSRKVSNNPEAWAGFYWIGRIPECVGMEFDTRKEANTAARDALRKKGF